MHSTQQAASIASKISGFVDSVSSLNRAAIQDHEDYFRGIRGLIRRNWRTLAAAVAISVDIGIMLFAFALATLLQYPASQFLHVLWSHSNLLFYTAGLFLFFCTGLGIYRTISYTPLKWHFFAATKAFVYSVGIIFGALFLARNLFYPQEFLLAFFLFVPIAYISSWLIVRRCLRMVRRYGFGRWNTLVIGSWKNLDALIARFKDFPDVGYDTVKIMKVPFNRNGDRKLHVSRFEVEKAIKQNGIELMVLSSSELNGDYDELEALCRKHYVRMRVVSPETDSLFLQTGIHDIAGLPLFSPLRERIDAAKQFAKRLFDIVASSVLLLILSPVFLVVAIATKLESKGPVFFKQKRSLTDRDRPFEFYKFRSMYLEADEKKETLFARNESNGALFKMKNDPRLTKVGKYIRRYSIDELPQLFNVLKGEMSIVGPRPLPVADFKRIREDDEVGGYFRGRAKVKPGMTGLWQVSGRSHLGFREMVMLDLYYIENQSLLFDLEILTRTIPVVMFGKGAY